MRCGWDMHAYELRAEALAGRKEALAAEQTSSGNTSSAGIGGDVTRIMGSRHEIPTGAVLGPKRGMFGYCSGQVMIQFVAAKNNVPN